MTELREALSVREGDRELNEQFMLHPSTILQACQSLVTYEERNDVVRFTHYSVQEFLAGCKLLSHDVAAKACRGGANIKLGQSIASKCKR